MTLVYPGSWAGEEQVQEEQLAEELPRECVHSQVFLPSLEKVQGVLLSVPAAVGKQLGYGSAVAWNNPWNFTAERMWRLSCMWASRRTRARGKGLPSHGVSDLIVCGVYFQSCFRVVWVLLHCFSFSSKVDESICRVCGLPFVFFPCSGHPLCFVTCYCVSLHWKSQWPHTGGVYRKPSQNSLFLQLYMACLKKVTCLSHKQETALVGDWV